MAQKLEKSACLYGTRLISGHLTAFQQEISGALTANDIEHIHQLRVYSRRLRSALPLFKACLPVKKNNRWIRQIHVITRALGEARDLDVQIDSLKKYVKKVPDKKFVPGIQRLILRQTQLRTRVQENVVKVLQQLDKKDTLNEMANKLNQFTCPEEQLISFPVSLYQLSASAICKRLQQFLSFEEKVQQPECIEELHQMRIAAKSLRYTIEVFAPIYTSQLKIALQTIRKVQDTLGNIHDCDMWTVYLGQFMDEEKQKTLDYFGNPGPFNFLLPGLQHFEQNRQEERKRLYEKFINDWQQWKIDGIWDALHKNIEIPSFPVDALNVVLVPADE